MPWLQLRINSSRDRVARVETALESVNALSITLEDNADQPIFEPGVGETPLWEDTRVTGLFDADIDSNSIGQTVAKQLGIASRQLHWHVLEDKDWEREWMSTYHPIQCAEGFWVCPSWLEQPDPDAINLVLDPGLAFGTGTHPTTFLCLKWLAKQNLEDKQVLDYGCGSGILGVAALLLGADNVYGVDIDPQALIATQENTQRNHLPAERFPVYFPEKAPAEQVDILLANILAGPLVELAPELLKRLKPGGLLCLSGVLESQTSAIESAYKNVIEFEPIASQDNWVCLTGRKR